MKTPIYAIGDIHGHINQLKRVHELIERDQATQGYDNAKVVHIGDLTDRGPDSRGVIQHLIDGREAGKNWITIKGNHDRFFQMFVEDPDWSDRCLRPELTWLHPRMGGLETLKSYGIDATAQRNWFDLATEAQGKVPPDHTEFLRDLPLYHEHDELLFVHAGLRPGIAIKDQNADDLMWMREPFLAHKASFGPLVIHGHTMVSGVEHHGNRVNIDTGAGRGNDLSAVLIEGRKVWLLEQHGRRLLEPQKTA
ncbi:MAG: serine/threonine protein phosphatase [Alphaproteobacteria bacterium]|nr:serine/threonine protein phosphatase [Alphaproteobacteria bacterium]